jgi:NAD(P)-dependent dehydrogenase (short-subunit alcohol dehydrogenase family)
MTILPTTPSFRLDGRRALVTGGGRGIGLAAATVLAEAGAHVVLAARSTAEIEAAALAMRERGWSAEALHFDALDTARIDPVLDAAGPFHILVNNAGTNRPKPMTQVSVEDFDAVVDLNVRAAFFVARAVVRGMLAAGLKGSIINVSSQMGHVGGSGRTVYCASKFAIEGLTKAMAVEHGPAGIRVNTICPTLIVTEMTRPYLSDAASQASVLSKIKLGRLGEIEDVMGPVLFLASDASALVTGSALMVDGGWTAD